jgi:hypothetical protein
MPDVQEHLALPVRRTCRDPFHTETAEGSEMMRETSQQQVDRLAKFIMEEVPGEPSHSEGAVDTAIRIIRHALDLQQRDAELVSHIETVLRPEMSYINKAMYDDVLAERDRLFQEIKAWERKAMEGVAARAERDRLIQALQRILTEPRNATVNGIGVAEAIARGALDK